VIFGRLSVAAAGRPSPLSALDRAQGVTQEVSKSLTRSVTCVDAAVETMQSVPDALVSLAEGPPRTAGCIYSGSSALLPPPTMTTGAVRLVQRG
jgi:hypothetical protein